MQLKIKTVKLIEVYDWDKLVETVYGRPYAFQQQEGCQPRGIVNLTVPFDDNDSEMNDDIPEVDGGDTMGVKFEKWLQRDPLKPLENDPTSWGLGFWWERKFYPDLQTVANDLHKKGLLEAGEYLININW